MNPVRLLIVLVAAVSAIGLAVVMQRAFYGKPAAPVAATAPAAGKPMTQVLVAKHDLAIGARLTGDDVTWQPWPTEAVNAAFITNGAAAPKAEGAKAAAATVAATATDMIGGVDPAKAVEGAIVRDPILTGEPITPRKIVRGGDGGYLSVVLQPGKRAMAVPITSETAVGGFILPGDRVDVLQTHDAPRDSNDNNYSNGRQLVAETILQNVRVLALDQSTAAEKDAKSIVAATATIEVSPIDAEALTKAKATGPVTLSLRAYTDLGGPSGVTSKPAAQRKREEPVIIRINRGGQTTNIPVLP
jgi:pilus assembly protein CpaB